MGIFLDFMLVLGAMSWVFYLAKLEFLEWLSWNGMTVCEQFKNGRTTRDGEYVPVRVNTNQLLAKYFGIDLAKIEAEKCSMLDEIRRSHEKRA